MRVGSSMELWEVQGGPLKFDFNRILRWKREE